LAAASSRTPLLFSSGIFAEKATKVGCFYNLIRVELIIAKNVFVACHCKGTVISDQQARAASLKQRTERTHSMPESDVTQLRTDIKVGFLTVFVCSAWNDSFVKAVFKDYPKPWTREYLIIQKPFWPISP